MKLKKDGTPDRRSKPAAIPPVSNIAQTLADRIKAGMSSTLNEREVRERVAARLAEHGMTMEGVKL